jgi:hypothetical protein
MLTGERGEGAVEELNYLCDSEKAWSSTNFQYSPVFPDHQPAFQMVTIFSAFVFIRLYSKTE